MSETSTAPGDFITFVEGRARQTATLARMQASLAEQVGAAASRFAGTGPVFVAMGASLAAAGAPVWHLRERGVESFRLGAGEVPLPLATTPRMVIAVSQSGSSTETVAVLGSVDPVHRAAVINVTPSTLADAADLVIDLGGVRDSYASTVGYTGTLMALGMIADVWDGGSVHSGWRDVASWLAEFEAALGPSLADAAEAFTGVVAADFVGAGGSVGSTEAAALLFREVARLPSSAMSTRQYLHGSMESAGNCAHVIIGGDRERFLAHQLADAGHSVLLLTADDAVMPAANLRILRLPTLPVAQRALLEVVAMQALVERVSAARSVPIESFVFSHVDTKIARSGAAAS